jgi:hypothetical protein
MRLSRKCEGPTGCSPVAIREARDGALFNSHQPNRKGKVDGGVTRSSFMLL